MFSIFPLKASVVRVGQLIVTVDLVNVASRVGKNNNLACIGVA